MEKITNTESVPGDSEVAGASKVEGHGESLYEKGGDAAAPVVEGESAQRIKVLRKEILSTDGAKGKEPAAPQTPPLSTERGDAAGKALGTGGKFLWNGFKFLGALLALGVAEGFSGMLSSLKQFSAGGSKGGGGSHGPSHAKASHGGGASSAHAPSGGHKKEGGHAHH
jgi:hypothetical protein